MAYLGVPLAPSWRRRMLRERRDRASAAVLDPCASPHLLVGGLPAEAIAEPGRH
ncbi:hypothetical protein [Bailinhaonella thermotolerans]|uniref:hypothetical protein n=1 Tax=Bailinhaonella thermotolerans TaxID=1070861 RepID=UPI00192A5531|nr:hypothetical protein [Bailinhaonella thermotolerans]